MTVLNFDMTMPVVGTVPCGNPEHPFDDIRAGDRECFFQQAGLHPGLTYLIVVKGDSMIDTGLSDGDMVFVDCSLEPKDGDIVLAALNGEHTIKRLHIASKSWTKRIELIAENKRYQPIVVEEGDELTFLGVIVGRYMPMR